MVSSDDRILGTTRQPTRRVTRRAPIRATSGAALTCMLLVAAAPQSRAATVEALGSSTISHDETARTWTLAAGGARLVLSLDRSADYQLLKLESPTGANWIAGAATTDTWVVINGRPEPFGRRDAGFEFDGVATNNTGHVLQLAASYRYRPANLRVVRHLAVADGSPTFELWTTFESLGGEADLSDLNGFELRVRDGSIRWLNGLQGDTSDVLHMSAFSTQSTRLGPGGTIMRSPHRLAAPSRCVSTSRQRATCLRSYVLSPRWSRRAMAESRPASSARRSCCPR